MSQIQRKHLMIALVAVLVIAFALAGASLMATGNAPAKDCCAVKTDSGCCADQADGKAVCCADGCDKCANCADGCENCTGCAAKVCCTDGCANCTGCADGCAKCADCAKSGCCDKAAAKGDGDNCCKNHPTK